MILFTMSSNPIDKKDAQALRDTKMKQCVIRCNQKKKKKKKEKIHFVKRDTHTKLCVSASLC